MRVFSFLILVTYFSNEVLPSRILGIFPIPSVSHQVVFRKLYLELAKRGHELIVMTPNPALPKNRLKDNVTEIDVSFSYEFIAKELENIEIFQKGVYADVNTVSLYLYQGFLNLIKEQIQSYEVNRLIKDKTQKFDLILVEAYFNLPLIFSHIFDAPVIQISSFHGLPENYETVGAVASHPKYYPNFNRNKFRDLTFMETLVENYYEVKLRYEFWKVKNAENIIIKELFGPEAPTIDELKNNVAMLFVNTHPLFDDNKPVPPSVVYLGAIHLEPLKKLPKKLQEYLDNSKTGVIYVSFGSNVMPSKMDKDMLRSLINAFDKLPYDILWKFDIENIKSLPKNVKTQKWFPQRDILVHPNIKAFVTQGGLQSTDEAIYSGVPLVGIPMLGDQFYNVNKYVQLGIGVKLDALTFTEDDLVEAVKEIVENDSYRSNVQHLSRVMQDQPISPLDRAVWWTEHVIRHKGAIHLRAPAANICFLKYLQLDLLLILLAVVGSFVTVICLMVCCFCKKLRGSGKNKSKVD